MSRHRAIPALPVLAAIAAASGAPPAQAAESFDSCAGTIASLPAVISTQGVWCMQGDLSSASTSGNAITVTANNVTIDCNGFKLGGLAAGPATTSFGIFAENRTNITVRHCNLRGFLAGIAIVGTGGGHVVEDNRFDGITFVGVSVEGDGSAIRRNQVFDTGGSTLEPVAQLQGITLLGSGDIIDNAVRGVDASYLPEADVIGIFVANARGASVRDNRVSGLVKGTGAGDNAIGIAVATSAGVAIRGNDLDTIEGDIGIRCTSGAAKSVARENVMHDFAVPILNCADGGGNWTWP